MKILSFVLKGNLKKKEELKQEIIAKAPDNLVLSFYETKTSGDARYLAEKAIATGTDYLVAVGGDGMLNEVVNGYMNATPENRGKTAVGLLPYGTGNDFSKTIGIKNSMGQLFHLISAHSVKPVDLGLITFTSHSRQSEKRYFINITDIGIGGFVVKDVNLSSKLLGADLTYTKAIIKSFFTYRHTKVKLTSTAFNWEGPILSLCLANGRYFGSGLCIAPDADVSDGLFDLVILGNVRLMDYIKNMSKIRNGIKIVHPEVIYEKVRDCTLVSPEARECPIDMDGEFIGFAPIDFRVLHHEVKFLRT